LTQHHAARAPAGECMCLPFSSGLIILACYCTCCSSSSLMSTYYVVLRLYLSSFFLRFQHLVLPDGTTTKLLWYFDRSTILLPILMFLLYILAVVYNTNVLLLSCFSSRHCRFLLQMQILILFLITLHVAASYLGCSWVVLPLILSSLAVICALMCNVMMLVSEMTVLQVMQQKNLLHRFMTSCACFFCALWCPCQACIFI
jgi:hypothetical protein